MTRLSALLVLIASACHRDNNLADIARCVPDDTTSTFTSEDADCDGAIDAEDCDPTTRLLGGVANDADCDGVLTLGDCDDHDPASTTRADDGDCDGAPNDDTDTPVIDTDPGDTDPGDTPVIDDEDDDDDGSLDIDDCDDTNPNVYPGAVELCDGVDQDCVAGGTEEGLATFLPTSGAPVDLTAGLAGGVEQVLTGSGTVYLCAGTWTGVLTSLPNTSVDVIGEPSHATPVFTDGGLTFGGAGSATGLTLEDALVIGGANEQLTLSHTTLTGTPVGLNDGASLAADHLVVRGPLQGAFLYTVGQTYALRHDVTLDDCDFNNVGVGGSDIHFTVHDTAFVGTAGLVASQLLMEDCTFDGGHLSVSGTYTESAVIRRVSVRNTRGLGWYLSNLASVEVTDAEMDGAAAEFFETIGVAQVTVHGGSYVGTNNASLIKVFSDPFQTVAATVTDVAFEANGETTALNIIGPVALTVRNATFDRAGNTAIHADGTQDVVVDGCTFRDNDAGGAVAGSVFSPAGGALYLSNPGYTTTITGSVFERNHATTDGGAILLNGGSLVIDGSTFRDNAADQLGGALRVWDATSVTIRDSAFEDNTAWSGGAVEADGSGAMSITGGHFYRNDADAVNLDARVRFNGVDLGLGADNNVPYDIGWNGTGGLYGVYSGLCTTQGCP